MDPVQEQQHQQQKICKNNIKNKVLNHIGGTSVLKSSMQLTKMSSPPTMPNVIQKSVCRAPFNLMQIDPREVTIIKTNQSKVNTNETKAVYCNSNKQKHQSNLNQINNTHNSTTSMPIPVVTLTNTSNKDNNIKTYQVITGSPASNLIPFLTTTSNSTKKDAPVNVIITSSCPTMNKNINDNNAVTAGKVVVAPTEASVIVRNRTSAEKQKQQQKPQQRKEIYKHIICNYNNNNDNGAAEGEGGSINKTNNAMLSPPPPRTTLLKPSLLQSKQMQGQQQLHDCTISANNCKTEKNNRTTKNIIITRQPTSFVPTPPHFQQQQQQNNGEQKNKSRLLLSSSLNSKDTLNLVQSNTVITTISPPSTTMSPVTTTAATTGAIIAKNKIPILANFNKMGKKNTSSNSSNQQISLLHTQSKNCVIIGNGNKDKNSLLKNKHEISVISPEVTLIRKSSIGNGKKDNKLNDNSLLKHIANNNNINDTMNATNSGNDVAIYSITKKDKDLKQASSQQIRSEVSLLKPLKSNNVGHVVNVDDSKEEKSLLKISNCKFTNETENTNKVVSGAGCDDFNSGDNNNNKKQESLLKFATITPITKTIEIEQTSTKSSAAEPSTPRHNRSQSFNLILKSPSPQNDSTNVGRRPSELLNANAKQQKTIQMQPKSTTIIDVSKVGEINSTTKKPSKDCNTTITKVHPMMPPLTPLPTTTTAKGPARPRLNGTKNNIQKHNHNINNNNDNHGDNDNDDDDDITILPTQDPIESIEIVDDDDEYDNINDKSPNNINEDEKKINDAKNKNYLSLLCDEQVLTTSSSSGLSNNSLENSTTSITKSATTMPSSSTTTVTQSSEKVEKMSPSIAGNMPLLKKTLTEAKTPGPTESSYSSVLDVLSCFNMLNWRERVGTARGTNLKFQLNEFNLVQVHERCPPRLRIHTAYEKPINDRVPTKQNSNSDESPLLYQCRRCRSHGPAVDFLAPEFCSLLCLKRDNRKRHREELCKDINKKRLRRSDPLVVNLLNTIGPKFRWNKYLLENQNAISAPISLFLNPFPTGPNHFKVGMKLEAIDPDNCSLFCVCTIIEINGYRLKLTFDGYDSTYDFWVNADSMDIFPPGWCNKTNRILQPPKGLSHGRFNWTAYLTRERAIAAPRNLFTHLNTSSLTPHNPFKIGMHLEAEDLNDTGKLCVASVADILGDRIRIHFDGWDECYDIIVDTNSPYIHPCGWHEGRQQLVVPPECEHSSFNWAEYIRKKGRGAAANEELFDSREPINFRPQMKLEVVDPRNASLIRPATVIAHKGHRVKLHLDGWPNDYCFWLEDDSPDLHPIGWCETTGHDLEPPPGYHMSEKKMPCPVLGCRGIGNARKHSVSVHANRDCCPYAPENWRIVLEKPTRLNYEEIVRLSPPSTSHQAAVHDTKKQTAAGNQQVSNSTGNQNRLSDQEILERLQMLDNIKPRRILLQKENTPGTKGLDFLGFSSPSPTNNILPVTAPVTSTPLLNDTKVTPITKSNSLSIDSLDDKYELEDLSDDDDDLRIHVAKRFLCDYGPRLQQNYNLWQKNFDFDTSHIKQNPMLWSTAEVAAFVQSQLNCRETAGVFKHECIDGTALLMLDQNDLTDNLGMKIGPSVRLFACIMQLRTLAVTKFNVCFPKESCK